MEFKLKRLRCRELHPNVNYDNPDDPNLQMMNMAANRHEEKLRVLID